MVKLEDLISKNSLYSTTGEEKESGSDSTEEKAASEEQIDDNDELIEAEEDERLVEHDFLCPPDLNDVEGGWKSWSTKIDRDD